MTNRNQALMNMAKTKLALDQNIAIEGKLSTSRFITEDNRIRNRSAIIVTELCIFKDFAIANSSPDSDTNETQSIDENCVELLGTVNSSIKGNHFKTFRLATIKYE